MKEKIINSLYLLLFSLNGALLVKYGWRMIGYHTLHTRIQADFVQTSLAAGLVFLVLSGLQYLAHPHKDE